MSINTKTLTSALKESWVNLSKNLDGFLFGVSHFSGFLILRLVVGFTLAIFYSIRLVDFDFLYSNSGMLTSEAARTMFPDEYRPLVFLFSDSDQILFGLHLLFIPLLISIALGWGGRVVALLAFGIHTMFAQRNFMVVYGTDFIASVWLFYILIVGLRPRPGLVTSLGYRLFQLHVCIIYFYGGLEKYKGVSWWDGSALFKALSNGLYTQYDLSFLAHIPIVLVIGTYFSGLWETYFSAVVWSPRFRHLFLVGGVFMHGLIAALMSLYFFSIMMVSSYFLFIDPKLADRIWARLQRAQPKLVR